LPFTDRKAQGRGYWWSVKPTGKFHADYEIGRQHAMDFWRQCGAKGNLGFDLGEILLAMYSPKQGRHKGRRDHFSGIECGFIRTIGELMACLVGVPALVSSLPENSRKLKIKKPVFRKKIKTTVDFVELLVRSGHERDHELSAKILPTTDTPSR
jgi:hypothetical protein